MLCSLDHVFDQLYRHSLDDILCIYSLCNKGQDNFGEGNSYDMARTFILKKKRDKIMAGVGSRSTCRRLFKNLHILPVRCQYIFSLIFGRGEAYTGFWWGNLRERDHLTDPGVDGRIILRWVFRK